MSHYHETNPHFLPRQPHPIIEFPSQTPPRRSRPPSRTHGRTPVVPPPPHYHDRNPVERPPHGRTPVVPPPHGHATVEVPPLYHDRNPVGRPPHGRTPVEALPHSHGRTPVEPPPQYRTTVDTQPHFQGRTLAEPPPHGRTPIDTIPHGRTPPHPTTHYPPTNIKPVTTLQVEAPHQSPVSEPESHHGRGRGRGRGLIHPPTSGRTKPIAWLVAAFCTLFWVLVIVGGLIILTVYLVFRPRSPRFDISSVTINAAYLDMGYLLNADVTVLANFSNPNSKVKVEFSYVILDLYYDNNFIATRYVEPFSVMRGESRFADVHMVASQVRLSTAQSVQLQKQMEQGRVKIEIKGLFRTRSKLGGIFKYSYWLYAHCQLTVTGPPTGVLIHKSCITKK